MNDKREVLARRYAQAFLNVYSQEYTQEYFILLKEVAHFFKTHSKTCYFMQLSLLEKIVKEEALHRLCVQLSLPDSYKRLFSLLIDQKRVFLLPDIFKQLVYEYQIGAHYMPIKITAPITLEPHEQKTLVDFLAHKTNTIVLPEYFVDTSLIAGVRALSGNYLFEHSVQATLRNAFRSLQ